VDIAYLWNQIRQIGMALAQNAFLGCFLGSAATIALNDAR
jgi:hypothetical protein